MQGRAQELWLIRQRLRKVSRGDNGLIILDGPRGTGKTELLRHVSATAAQSGFAVIDGPFGHHKRLLLAAALTDHADHRPSPGPTGQTHPPDGRTHPPNGRVHPPDGEARLPGSHPDTGLLDAVLAGELGCPAASVARPVLVALDDVAWDDPDVRAALPRLPLPGTARRVLWLLSGTGGPAPAPSSPGTDHITLGPLSRPDALRLAAERLGLATGTPATGTTPGTSAGATAPEHRPTDEPSEPNGPDRPGETDDLSELGELIEACGGHPALLAAVLNHLTTTGPTTVRPTTDALATDRPAAHRPATNRSATGRAPHTRTPDAPHTSGDPFPPHVLTTLLRDDPRLSARTRGLLRTIATRSRPVRTRELADLPHGRAVPLLGSVREATEAGVLVVDGDRLAFRHPLLRRAAALLPPDTPPAMGTDLGPDPLTAVAPAEETGCPLSPKEEAIVRLVARGLTNSQIATRVNLSPHTVNFHLRKIFRKLGVSSRVELVGARLHTTTRPPTQESRAAHAG